MKIEKGKRRVIEIALILALFVSGCASSTPEVVQPPVQPVVMVTQFVTQIVATRPPATSTPLPTNTLVPYVSSGGWDPLAQPVYYPAMGCVASRLYIGQRAFVAYIDGIAGIYQSKDIEDAPLFRKPIPGEILEILDGPWCRNGALVWKTLSLSDELVGYTPEGNGRQYWLLPMQPYTPTPD